MQYFLKQTQAPQEAFTDHQMYQLRELHEEVDMYMAQFRAKNSAYVLYDDIKGEIPPRNKEMIKKRTVWAIPEPKIAYYKREVLRYESRVLQITEGKPVMSISNKLIRPIEDVAYFMIKKHIGNQSRKIKLSSLYSRRDRIDKLFNEALLPPEEIQTLLNEKALVEKAILCAEASHKDHIVVRMPVNNIRFYGYDLQRKIITPPEGEHFRGGIIIGNKAQEVEVFSPYRKPRADKISESEKVYIDDFSYFVCKGE